MRGITTLLAIACFALQAVVYGKAPAATGNSVHCVMWPYGDCASAMASGYAVLLGGPMAGYRIGAALGLLVPMLMVWAFVYSSHGPKLVLERAGKRVPSRAALIYLMTLVAIVGMSALRLDGAAAAPASPRPGTSAYATSSGRPSRRPAARLRRPGRAPTGRATARAPAASAPSSARPASTAAAR